jgi:hypothetical protein
MRETELTDNDHSRRIWNLDMKHLLVVYVPSFKIFINSFSQECQWDTFGSGYFSVLLSSLYRIDDDDEDVCLLENI